MRPMGTRCTAGGELAGDVPKNRLNISLKGSEGPNPNGDIDMVTPSAQWVSPSEPLPLIPRKLIFAEGRPWPAARR